jgi:uncharacterized membrane protein
MTTRAVAGGRPRRRRRRRPGLPARLRADLLLGLVVVLPAAATAAIVLGLVDMIDRSAAVLLPGRPAFEQMLGFGLAAFVLLTVAVGELVKGVGGRALLARGDDLLQRVPLVRPLHAAAKQIVAAAIDKGPTAFRETCLVEYPERGIWTIALIVGAAEGELPARIGSDDLVALFIPTAPNPITGFLVFAPQGEIRPLAMGLEEAAKLVMSAGLVAPAPRPVGSIS